MAYLTDEELKALSDEFESIDEPEMSQSNLMLIIVIAGLVCFSAMHFIVNEDQEARIMALEAKLKGDVYLCSVRQKIKNTHINCDPLNNED
jgi:hypothetical protein